MLHLLVFRAYINKMHSSRSKIPSKNLVSHRCAERFNSGFKGLSIRVKTCSAMYGCTSVCTHLVCLKIEQLMRCTLSTAPTSTEVRRSITETF
jgi:hypothetical protein